MTFHCNKNYYLSDDVTLTCAPDGTWAGQVPGCLPNTCEYLQCEERVVQGGGSMYCKVDETGVPGCFICKSGGLYVMKVVCDLLHLLVRFLYRFRAALVQYKSEN